MEDSAGMDQFLRYHKRMWSIMASVCAIVAAGLIVIAGNDWSRPLGFACGAAAQLAKFGLIDVAVVKKIAGEKKDAAATQLKAMFFSLAVFGIAVVAVYKLGGNVWAMAAGIFLPRLILVADSRLRPNPFANDTEQPKE